MREEQMPCRRQFRRHWRESSNLLEHLWIFICLAMTNLIQHLSVNLRCMRLIHRFIINLRIVFPFALTSQYFDAKRVHGPNTSIANTGRMCRS